MDAGRGEHLMTAGRQPRGIPAGGQFAATAHAESS